MDSQAFSSTLCSYFKRVLKTQESYRIRFRPQIFPGRKTEDRIITHNALRCYLTRPRVLLVPPKRHGVFNPWLVIDASL